MGVAIAGEDMKRDVGTCTHLWFKWWVWVRGRYRGARCNYGVKVRARGCIRAMAKAEVGIGATATSEAEGGDHVGANAGVGTGVKPRPGAGVG